MKTVFSFLATLVLTALCGSGGMAKKAHANALVADLSKDQIRVASNFTGEKILLFGAIEGTGPNGASDVVVVVRGPSENFTLRRKKRVAGIWVNAEARTLGPLPGYYAVASTRALADIAPVERAKHQIGPEYLHFSLLNQTPEAAARFSGPRDIALYHDSFVRIKSGQNLYSVDPNGVSIIADRVVSRRTGPAPGLPLVPISPNFSCLKKASSSAIRLANYRWR